MFSLSIKQQVIPDEPDDNEENRKTACFIKIAGHKNGSANNLKKYTTFETRKYH